jgi:hypothetical protein
MLISTSNSYTEGRGFVRTAASTQPDVTIELVKNLFFSDSTETHAYFYSIDLCDHIATMSERRAISAVHHECPFFSIYDATLLYERRFYHLLDINEYLELIKKAVLHKTLQYIELETKFFTLEVEKFSQYSEIPFPCAKRALYHEKMERARYEAARACMACFSVCEDCGEKMRLDTFCHACKAECEECGEVCEKDAMREIGGNLYCADCAEDFTECACCGEALRLDDATEADGEIYCESCFEERFFTCDDCGGVFPIEQENNVYDRRVCNTCFSENYCTCESCGEVICIDNAIFSEHDGASYCEQCYSERGPEGVEIHEYSYKPNAVFHDCGESSKLYFGMELEYNADRKDKIASIEPASELSEDDIYVKTDGSISGYELVSHPRTLASWKEYLSCIYASVLQDIESNGGEVDNGTGIHIHVSKSAMTDAHKARFAMFVNNFSNLSAFVACRSATEYQRYFKKTEEDFENASRYEAVNWYNSATVELRIYKSSFDKDVILSYLQHAHAVYQYTKQDIRACDMSINDFISFVNERKEVYPELAERLNNFEI